MTCGHCVRAITQALKGNDPTADVQIDLASGEVRVDSKLDVDEISRLITAEGYAVQVV